MDERIGWTEERTALVLRLWDEGLSGQQIADYLGGGATRNAVIGKLDRLRIKSNGTYVRPVKPRKPTVDKAKPAKKKQIQPKPATSKHVPRQKPSMPKISRATRPKESYTAYNTKPLPEPVEVKQPSNPNKGHFTISTVPFHKHCKWPTTPHKEIQTGNMTVCGAATNGDDDVYCPFHMKKSHSHIQPRGVQSLSPRR